MGKESEKQAAAARDPYALGLIQDNPYHAKRPLMGRLVAVLDVAFQDRGLMLESYWSRAIPQGSIHELVLTDERAAAPGHAVAKAAYLGFFETLSGGIILTGDAVEIGGRRIGTVVGFDASHAPNHLNIVIRGAVAATGAELNLNIEDEIRFTMPG